MKLTIPGNTPSKKNGKQISINRRTGARFVRSSDKAKAWELMAITELRQQFEGLQVTEYPISITMSFFYDNKRRHDLDNGAATALDALTLAGVIEDDNVNYIDCITLQYGGIDKERPRVEIYIEE